MSNSILRSIVTLGTLAVLSACSGSDTASVTAPTTPTVARGPGGDDAEVVLRTSLTPPANSAFPRAQGEAKFKSKGGERELQIEVEDLPAGTEVTFSLGGAQVGTATADGVGTARINLNSDRGQSVPMSVSGMSVSVETAAGAAVVSGSF